MNIKYIFNDKLKYYRVGRENLHTYKIACHFSCINTIQTCHTGMKRKFCGLLGEIFKNCEKCSYEAVFTFFWQEAESAYANLKSNFKIRGYLRPIWPLTSNIWLFWFKNCIVVVFFTSDLPIIGLFAIYATCQKNASTAS